MGAAQGLRQNTPAIYYGRPLLSTPGLGNSVMLPCDSSTGGMAIPQLSRVVDRPPLFRYTRALHKLAASGSAQQGMRGDWWL